MADNLESDTGVGFKRRVSNLFDTQLNLQNLESPVSPHQQSPVPIQEFVLESLNCIQKKAKCSSNQDYQKSDQEKQGIGNDKFEDVARVSGIEESGKSMMNSRLFVKEVDMNLVVENCDNHLAESCKGFSENVSDSFLERVSGTEESGKSMMNPRLFVKEVDMKFVVENCDSHLDESCKGFSENVSDRFLERVSRTEESGKFMMNSRLFVKEGDMNLVVENRDNHLDESCKGFSENVSDRVLERVSGTEESGKSMMNPRLFVKEVDMNLVVENRNNRLAESCKGFSENVSADRFSKKKKEQFSSVCKSLVTNLGVKSHSNEVQKMVHRENQRPRSENIKCALKIQVIDDTAVIGSVSGVSKNVIIKNQHQETYAKEKQPRRREKIMNKWSAKSGDETKIFKPIAHSRKVPEITAVAASVQPIIESRKVPEIRAVAASVQPIVESREVPENAAVAEKEKKRWTYSRTEMNALRFENVEEQKKKWVEIYGGFGFDMTKEYDGLVDSKVDIRVKFDPRLPLRKKDSAPPILSWVAAKEKSKAFENLHASRNHLNQSLENSKRFHLVF